MFRCYTLPSNMDIGSEDIDRLLVNNVTIYKYCVCRPIFTHTQYRSEVEQKENRAITATTFSIEQ